MADRDPAAPLPEVDSDTRSEIDVPPADPDGKTPLEPTVSPDGAGGAGGHVRNQDEAGQ